MLDLTVLSIINFNVPFNCTFNIWNHQAINYVLVALLLRDFSKMGSLIRPSSRLIKNSLNQPPLTSLVLASGGILMCN